MTLQGSALVTGAAGGIGAAVTAALAEAGYAVIAVDRDFSDASESKGVTLYELDLQDLRQCQELVAELPDPLTVLVNAAAVRVTSPVLEQDIEGWRSAFEVNVLGAFVMLQAVARRMESGGAIVNVASAAAYGKSDLVAYGASKAALISLTKTAAIELDARKVRVNAVLPGTTDTPMLSNSGAPSSGPRTRNVGGRVLDPAAVGAAVLRVVGDPMLSGAVIPVGLLPNQW